MIPIDPTAEQLSEQKWVFINPDLNECNDTSAAWKGVRRMGVWVEDGGTAVRPTVIKWSEWDELQRWRRLSRDLCRDHIKKHWSVGYKMSDWSLLFFSQIIA